MSAGSGSCSVTASITADAFYDSANSSNTVTITVSKASQAITFAELSNRTLGSGTFTVSATGGASGNAVTFTSETPGTCSVDGTTVTLVATGTCTINANQAGDSNYNAATQVQQLFSITEAVAYSVSSVTASPTSGSATVGYGSAVSTTLTLTRAGDSGSNPTTTLSVTGGNWTVSGGSNVTTSSESLSSGSSVTLTLSASSGTITLALATGANAGSYTASTNNSPTQLSYAVTIALANQTISFGSLSNRTLGSGTFTVSATGGASGNAVTFTSETPGTCSVDGTTVTLVATGTCTINANQAGDSNYNAATQVQQLFSITEAVAYSVSSVTASPTSGSATVGYGSAVSTTLTLTRAGDSGSNPTTTLSVTGGNWTVSGGSNVTTSSESLSSGSSVTLTLSASSGTITLALNTGSSAGTYTASTTSTTPLSYAVTVSSGAVSATYNSTTLAEAAANNGSITGTLTITLSNETFSASDGTNLAARVTNTPRGLTPVLTIGSSKTVATLSFTGNANSHANSHDINNLTITFLTTDFTLSALPTGANRSDLVIDFSSSVTIATNNALDIKKNEAKLNGQANEALTDSKFCIKTSTFSTKSECTASGTEIAATVTPSVGSSVVMEKVATLNPSTTYYYIVHGVSTTGGEVTGEVRSFKTKPEVETKAPSSKTARSARLNATVSEALTSPKFCYKASSFTTLSDCLTGGSIDTATVVTGGAGLVGSNKTTKKTGIWSTFVYLKARVAPTPTEFSVGETTYALTVSGLTPSTTYYYIIYGTVDGAEYDGGVMNLTTLAEEAGGSGGSSGSSSTTPAPTPGPTISSISKSLVCFTGTELTISGSYFGGAIVTLDGNSANIRENSGSSIRVLLPSSAVGRRTITVTTSYGSAIAYIDYVSLPKPKYEPIRIPYLAQGDSIYLPFAATGALSYSLTGKLPQGLSFNTSTGLISGVSIENGIFILSMVAEGCGETSQLVELDIDAPTPNAISHRINFNRNSCTIPDAAKESLERFLEKAKGISPRNIIPEIYVSGGGKASDPNSPLAECRQEAICDFLLLEDLLGEVLSDVFTGAENRIEIIVYWPRPNDGQ